MTRQARQQQPSDASPSATPRIIEISDEDYKQNTVYRPWHLILPRGTRAAPDMVRARRRPSPG